MLRGVAVSAVAQGFGRVRSAWRDSLVRGPRPLVRALGLVASPTRAQHLSSGAPALAAFLPQPVYSGARKKTLSVSSLPTSSWRDRAEAFGALRTRDPLSEESGEGARGGEEVNSGEGRAIAERTQLQISSSRRPR